MTRSTGRTDLSFLEGGGVMGDRIRQHDWSCTVLGEPARWPASLRTALMLLLNTGHPMCIFWGAERIWFYNDPYSHSLGPERHPLSLGRHGHEVWAETWDTIGPQIEQVMSGRGATWHENQLVPITRHGKQEDVYWTYSYSPIHAASTASGIGGVVVIVTETTEQMQTARRLRESEARLRDLNADLERQVIERAQARSRTWRVSPDLLGALDGQGYFKTSNPAWKAVLGWSEQEVAAMSIFELLHPDDVERTRAGFNLTQEGQPAIRFPNRYRCKDGSYRWISWVGVPDDDGLVYCSGRDITEERLATQALERAEAALRQSQKMEAVGQLTGGLAHDFNNMLAGISGSLDVMKMRVAQGRIEEVDRYMTAAKGAVRRAAALTHRLLAFSRRQTLDPKPTNVNRLVAEMEELVRRTVGPAVYLEVVGAGGLWPTLVDPNQLENALLNLCINARDAMPDGGRLTIETANLSLDERAAQEHDLAPGPYVSLSVTDSGVGMPPAVVAKAFDPFFTTKPLGEGTGLGLSMVYGFARQSGGQVRIHSQVGQGSTLCVYLPRHDQDAEVPGQPVIPSKLAHPGHGEVVLIIDDEPTIRMVIAEVLEEAGYAAIEASDGPSGLRVLQSGTRIDLLITDVGLPGGLNGRQVADAARVARPDLKVLFITGYAENAAVGNGHLDKGMAVVTKPFSMEGLAQKIRLMMAS